jgi:DNA polymerase-2
MMDNNKSMINSGFLLSRQVHQSQQGLQIILWIKSSSGAIKLLINNELALFFIEQTQLNAVLTLLAQNKVTLKKFRSLSLKTFNQQAVSVLYFSSLHNFYRAREILAKNNIKSYEDDIRPEDRFLMERSITASLDYQGFTSQGTNVFNAHHLDTAAVNQFTLVNNTQCKRNDNPDDILLSMLSIDIECSENDELYSIGLYALTKDEQGVEIEFKKVLMIGQHHNSCENYIDWLSDEQQLLHQFIHELIAFDADILIGWNVINFDFLLLQKRCDFYQIELAIGRDGSVPYWRHNKNNSEQNFIEIAGRVVLDGIDLLKTATYSFTSFSLDNVAYSLLGLRKKVSNIEEKLKEITDNFKYDKPALAAYNIEDCRLVWLIFEKAELLSFAKLRSQLTGLALGRVGGSVAAFTNLYLPKLHRHGYIAPNLGDTQSSLVSPGGYVMQSTPGLYKNVLLLDFKSLYPSIIRTFKIDPMGLVEGLKQVKSSLLCNDEIANIPLADVISGYDGAYFSREQHFLPSIIELLWSERDKAKKLNNKPLSQAIKIIMNSFYGVLGSTGCRFFDPRLSGSITKRSHDILKVTRDWILEAGYQVIYGDTDSLFIAIDKEASDQEAQRVGLSLQQLINDKWREKLEQNFNIVSYLDIEFETHFSTFLMPRTRGSINQNNNQATGTKKRYAGKVGDKIIFKGLEAVRSDWTDLSKEFQQKIYHLVFNHLSVTDYIMGIVRDIKLGLFDEKLILKKTIRRQLTEYVNTPPHIKAALLANKILMSQGCKPKYSRRTIIKYVITLDGVQPFEFNTSKLDYDFYINKQLKPIANDILPFIGKDFDVITSKQLGLF